MFTKLVTTVRLSPHTIMVIHIGKQHIAEIAKAEKC